MFLCLPEQRRSVFIAPTRPSTGSIHWCYLGYCVFQSVHFAIALPLRISSCRDFHLEVHHIGAWQRSSRQTVIPFVSFHAKVAWSSSLDPFVLPPSALYPLKLLLGALVAEGGWLGGMGWLGVRWVPWCILTWYVWFVSSLWEFSGYSLFFVFVYSSSWPVDG